MSKAWYHDHVRVAQTILRTKDVPGYDARAYIDHCVRLNANTAVINAAGLFAFYPTEVPGHRIVPGMVGDILGEVVTEAHRAGLKVMARVDFRAATEPVFNEHPDWVARDHRGEPVWVRDMYCVAATSPFRNEAFAFVVLDELLRRYEVDGIWENAPGFMNVPPETRAQLLPYPLEAVRSAGVQRASLGLVDYSDNTAQRFSHDTGYELPRPGEDFDFDAYRAYMDWRTMIVTERTAAVRSFIKGYGDLAYINEGPAQMDFTWTHRTGQDPSAIIPLWDVVAAPTFDVTRGSYGSVYYPTAVWRAEESAKFLAASQSQSPPAVMFGRFDNQSRYTTMAPDELRLWLAGGLANGAGFWECTFVGRETAEFLDRRCDNIIQEYYGLLADHPEAFAGTESIADVAVVHSQRTEDWLGSSEPAVDGYLGHVRGMFASLFGAHIPFDVLPASRLCPERLNRYRVIILANAAMLSDEECDLLRHYVAAGGGLVASYQTSLFDHDGSARSDFGLADVLGVSGQADDLVGPLSFAYSRIVERGPLTVGLDDTDLVTIEGSVQRVSVADSAQVSYRLVPEVRPQPPELGWVEDMSGVDPLVVRHHYREGRAVYFAGQQDKLVISCGHPDYSQQLINAIDWAAGGHRPLRTNAPQSVHVSAARRVSGGAVVVHLINYTAGPSRPLRDLVPCSDISIELPWDEQPPSRVHEVVSSAELNFVCAQGQLRFTLPRLEVYAAILIE